jgi:hypothetical protein
VIETVAEVSMELSKYLEKIKPVMVVGFVLVLLGSAQSYEAFDRWDAVDGDRPVYRFHSNRMTLLPSFMPGGGVSAAQGIPIVFTNRTRENGITYPATEFNSQPRIDFWMFEQIRDEFRQGVYIGFGGLLLIAYGVISAYRLRKIAG